VLLTYRLGQIPRTLMHPEATGKFLLYTLVVNILAGILFTGWLVHRHTGFNIITLRSAGFSPGHHTAMSVAVGIAAGLLFYIIKRLPSHHPNIFPMLCIGEQGPTGRTEPAESTLVYPGPRPGSQIRRVILLASFNVLPLSRNAGSPCLRTKHSKGESVGMGGSCDRFKPSAAGLKRFLTHHFAGPEDLPALTRQTTPVLKPERSWFGVSPRVPGVSARPPGIPSGDDRTPSRAIRYVVHPAARDSAETMIRRHWGCVRCFRKRVKTSGPKAREKKAPPHPAGWGEILPPLRGRAFSGDFGVVENNQVLPEPSTLPPALRTAPVPPG